MANAVIKVEAAAAERPGRSRGPWLQALARFRRRWLGVAALLVVLAFVVVAAAASRIAPYPAARLFLEYLNQPQGPSLHHGHLLGTDVIGHDMLSQLVFAVQETVVGALFCAFGATVIGVAVGAAAGYFGGLVDLALGWLTGVIVTMPALVLLVLLDIYEAPVKPFWLAATLTLYLWTSVARVVRASFLSLRGREFVEAAHAAGASNLRVLWRHLLPNSAGVVIVAATSVIAQSILLISTVDFFNFGSQQADYPTLGGLVSTAVNGFGIGATPWRLYVIPAVALGLLLVCINVAADTLDEALQPTVGR